MMNEKLILDLVEKGESGTTEFKRNFDKDALEGASISKEYKIPIIIWISAK
jgi:hypothetical protein